MPATSPLYAGIYSPGLIRKGILFTVRDSLTLLKRQQRLEVLGKQKLETVANLRDTLADLRQLMARAKALVPQAIDAPMERRKTTTGVTEFVPRSPTPLPPKKTHPLQHKIDYIEQELARLEDKMKTAKKVTF